MATLEEILERVGGSMIVSKIDLAKGFYQIQVEEESIPKTAFLTPFGKFEFRRMPFGLRNAPAVFQRAMEIVLKGCYEFAAPYIDDVVVFSPNAVEHVGHLKEVFQALGRWGMTVKLDKCTFGRTHVEYLGHMIGQGKLAVPSHRASAMAEYTLPKSKKN